MLRLSHFSDVHVSGGPLRLARGDWFSKRLTGWVNQRFVRGRRFRRADEILGLLAVDLRERRPDHVIFSGDATTLGLEGELTRAAELLGLGGPDVLPGLAVPGNHDYYVRISGWTFSTQRVVLAGIVCNAAFLGLVHWGLSQGDVDQASKASVWLVGSLHGRGWEHVVGVLAALVVLAPVALLLGRRLGVLGLGEQSAATLGISVSRTQIGLFAVAFALTGTAVAAAGPVNFVALLAPQIARRLVRSSGVPLVASALTGAALLLAADLLARLAIPGVELPAGAVTAVIGAPCLLWLVVRTGGNK